MYLVPHGRRNEHKFEERDMREFIAEAVRFAVIIEKKSYDLYRKAAMTVPDQGSKQIFDRLAREQSQHIDALLREHPGPWCCTLPQGTCSPLPQRTARQPLVEVDLNEPRGGGVFDQLRLALLDKRWCIDLYATFAKTFREPSLCRVFEVALDIARKQFRMITDEYRRADLALRTPEVNRRARRTHIRAGLHPVTPNKHSELFFSMLDSGRQSQL